MRDDVVGFLKAPGLEHVTLVGHSMGGVAAYLVAEDHPAMVNRLVLEELAPPFAATPPREVPDRPEEPVPFDWAVISAVTAQRNDPDPAWWDRLTEITAPTLVIGGGPTSHMPQDQLAAIAGRIPKGQMATIPVGHEVHAAQSAEFIAEIAAFLDTTG
jgi:pimeloyl-ACP methyl ester carboxylesterase